jgi:hypothetical protein
MQICTRAENYDLIFASVLEWAPQKSQANSDIVKNFCNGNTNLFLIGAATQK